MTYTKAKQPMTRERADEMLAADIERARAAHQRRVAGLDAFAKASEAGNLRALPEKQQEAMRLRAQGLSYRAIASKLGISAAWAASIVKKAERKQLKLRGLSVRAYNVIITAECSPSDPEKVARFGKALLGREPNCGAGTLAEIDAWVRNHGYSMAP